MPNDVLSVYSTNLNMAPGVTAQSRQSVQSKHFVFWYDPNVNPGGQTDWSTMTHNALHMLEEAYQVYTKVDGYKEPFTYVSGDATRYKINMTTWYSGYWESGPYFNVDTTGLQDEGSGNPVPHEFGHVVDRPAGHRAGRRPLGIARQLPQGFLGGVVFALFPLQPASDDEPLAAGVVELPPGLAAADLRRLPHLHCAAELQPRPGGPALVCGFCEHDGLRQAGHDLAEGPNGRERRRRGGKPLADARLPEPGRRRRHRQHGVADEGATLGQCHGPGELLLPHGIHARARGGPERMVSGARSAHRRSTVTCSTG